MYSYKAVRVMKKSSEGSRVSACWMVGNRWGGTWMRLGISFLTVYGASVGRSRRSAMLEMVPRAIDEGRRSLAEQWRSASLLWVRP
jgi:hypothetical protein